MFKALPRKGSRSTASSTKSRKPAFAQSRDTLKPPKGGSSLPRTQLPRYVPKQYWADLFKEVLIPRCAQIDERIFCRIKARNRRNTLCISRFRDEISRKICRQDVYSDSFSVSFKYRTISTALLSSAYYAQKLFFYLSPFCLAMKASTLSMTTGTRSMMRSTVLLAGGVTLIMRITPSLMTRKPMGLIFTPVALPPP